MITCRQSIFICVSGILFGLLFVLLTAPHWLMYWHKSGHKQRPNETISVQWTPLYFHAVYKKYKTPTGISTNTQGGFCHLYSHLFPGWVNTVSILTLVALLLLLINVVLNLITVSPGTHCPKHFLWKILVQAFCALVAGIFLMFIVIKVSANYNQLTYKGTHGKSVDRGWPLLFVILPTVGVFVLFLVHSIDFYISYYTNTEHLCGHKVTKTRVTSERRPLVQHGHGPAHII